MPMTSKLFLRKTGRVTLLLSSLIIPAAAQTGPSGIMAPTIFPPFDPQAANCDKPPGIESNLTFVQDNRRDFMLGVDRGLAAAAKNRNIGYRAAIADNDPLKQETQLKELIAAKAGAIVVSPVVPLSLAPLLQQFIWNGGYVGAVVPPPATSLLNAPQYLTGKALGDAAAAYIKERLQGKARVVLLTQDSLEFLAPRFVALRASLKDIPGVSIIADLSPDPVNKDGGYAAMNTVLQAHPDIDVVLGADTVVLGALQALRAAGKARPTQFLGGIDGEAEAISEIMKGEGPYKITISLASPVFGYAMGQHAADWLEGKSIPQAMDILPTPVTASNVAQYESELADPAKVYTDPTRRDAYLRMYGNICYDTRGQYVNFPWSSESK